MSKKSAAGLVQWAEDAYKNGWVYWYGTCGYDCTESLLKRKTAQYPSHYGNSRQAKYKSHIAADKICTDCIGLFKSYAWDADENIETVDGKYNTNEQPDKGAKQTLAACKVKGSMDSMPEIPGLALWTKTGGHIGVYVGNGIVVEARGYSYGVQRNKVSSRAFTTWGLYPYAEYTEEQIALAERAAKDTAKPDSSGGTSQPGSVVYDMKTLRNGDRTTQVKVLQILLNAKGYDCGTADGIFGTKTLEAVKAFQKAKRLDVDGVVGKMTWTALLA